MNILGQSFDVIMKDSRCHIVHPVSKLALSNGKNEREARENAINALKIAYAMVNKAPIKTPRPTAKVQGISQREAIQLARLFVAKKCTLPVLSNIRVTAKNGLVTYQATDLESGISISVPGSGECDITVPYKQLIPSDYSMNERTQSIIMNGIEIKGIESQEYPPMPNIEGKAYKFPLSMLDDLPKVLCAASKDEAKLVLMGIMFLETNGIITGLVAADGFRIHRVGDGNSTVNVPAVTLEKLLRIRKYISDDVTMTVTYHNQAVFECGSIQIFSNLIEGRYPVYSQVENTLNKMPYRITLNTADVIKAVTDLKPIWSAGSGVVRLNLGDGKITASAMNEETGEGEFEIMGESHSNPLKKHAKIVAFNGKFILDACANVDKVNAWLYMANAPATFEVGNYRATVMPMHL